MSGITMPGCPSLENVAKIDRGVIPFTRACVTNGMCVDREHFWGLSEHLNKKIEELTYKIAEYVPREVIDDFTIDSIKNEESEEKAREKAIKNQERISDFNPDSPDQIAALLFKYLRVGANTELETTKSGTRLSTGKKQLERLKKDHPVIPLILQRREYAKLISTYTQSLPDSAIYVPEIDRWKIYYNIGLTFTSTGRMTCSRLHQIPIRTEEGRKIRQGFLASPGCKLISIDFSGLEMRAMAHRAKERTMIKVFSGECSQHAKFDESCPQCVKHDIHATTQAGLNMPDTLDAIQKRLAAKRCIAKGQRVLTNHGLIPIEKITCHDLLWDGVEWVSHSGVVSNGVLPTIEHDGVRATLDHVVWAETGEMMYVAEAKRRGIGLAVTGAEETPIGFTRDNEFPHLSLQGVSDGGGRLSNLPRNFQDINRQYSQRADNELQMSTRSEVHRPTRTFVGRSVLRDTATVLQPSESELGELWRSWNQEQVSNPVGIRNLHNEKVAASQLQESGYRTQEQQWTLRARQSSAGNERGEQPQQANESLVDVQRQRISDDGFAYDIEGRLHRLLAWPEAHVPLSCDGNTVAGHSGAEGAWSVQETEVFDIVNAGPRHRFTVEGKLVANTGFGILFGSTDLGLWLTLQSDGVSCTREQCAVFMSNFFKTYFDVPPYIQQQFQRVRRYGFAYNPFGRVTPVPEFRSVHKRIVREGERRVQNWGIQSFATDIFKLAAAEVHDYCLEVEKGLFGKPYILRCLLPIHDQILIESSEEIAEEAAETIAVIMSNCIGLRVPLKADWSISERWRK